MKKKHLLPIPAFRLILQVLSLLLMLTMFSCKKSAGATESSGDPGPERNVIKGTIYDAHGHKFNIKGATVKIHIYGNGAIGQTDPMYNIEMDASSHYEIHVPSNVYAVHARAVMQLNGKQLMIELKPLDGKPDNINLPSDPGIVRDFALQLTGEIPGGDPSTIQGYYGGKIWLGDGHYNFTTNGYWENLSAKFPGAAVQLTLTPASMLIDGTAGQTISLQASVEEVKTGKWFVNIPLAVYHASATLLLTTGQQVPLGLSEIPDTGNAYTSIDLTFPPDRDDPFGGPQKEQIAVW